MNHHPDLLPPATGIWVGISSVAEVRRLTGSNRVVLFEFEGECYCCVNVFRISGTLQIWNSFSDGKGG